MALDGSHSSRSENSSIINMPRKIVGIDAKNSPVTATSMSAAEYFFTAASTPMGTPSVHATAMAKNASFSVVGNLGSRMSYTGRPN